MPAHQSSLGLRTDVVSAVIDDGAVLLDLATKYFYSVNSSGWAIVQLFEGGATVEEVKAICNSWAGEDQGDSVERFIEVLVGDKLLTLMADPPQEHNANLEGKWVSPTIEKHKEPLQRVMTSAFDPSIPLVE